jgi:hypothetical protein
VLLGLSTTPLEPGAAGRERRRACAPALGRAPAPNGSAP